MRLQRDFQRRALRVPNTVAIARQHAELMLPRGQVCIVRRPPRTSVHPVPIDPFQFILKARILGRLQVQSREMNLQFTTPRRNPEVSRVNIGLNSPAIGDDLVYKDGGWDIIESHSPRIEDYQPLACREAEP